MDFNVKKETIIFGVLLLVGLVIKLLYWNFYYDDAYISFRYVKNFHSFDEFVFNKGERVLGLTNFLWTALLTVSNEVVTLSAEVWSNIYGLVFHSTITVLGYLYLKKRKSTKAALVFSLLMTTDYMTNKEFMMGMEAPLSSLLAFLAVLCYLDTRHTSAFFLASLGVYARPELVFLIGLFSVHSLLERGWKNLLPDLTVSVLIAVLFHAFFWAYGGHPLPQSILTKFQHERFVGKPLSQAVLGQLNRIRSMVMKNLPAFALLLVGASDPKKWFRDKFFTLTIFIQPLLYMFVSRIGKIWYYPQNFPLVFLAAALGAHELFCRGIREKHISLALVGLVLFSGLVNARELVLTREQHVYGYRPFLDAGHRLAQEGVTWDDILVSSHIGMISYPNNVTIFDPLGLVTTGVSRMNDTELLEHLRSMEGVNWVAFNPALDLFNPLEDYVVTENCTHSPFLQQEHFELYDCRGS